MKRKNNATRPVLKTRISVLLLACLGIVAMLLSIISSLPFDKPTAIANYTQTDDYYVWLSFKDAEIVSQTTIPSENGYFSDMCFPHVIIGAPANSNFKQLKIRLRTVDGTAIGGVDYTPYDKTITVTGKNYVVTDNGKVYFESIPIYVKTDVKRSIVNGRLPYFHFEIAEIFDDNFTIRENAKRVTINLGSKDAHNYTTEEDYGAQMFSGYLQSARVVEGIKPLYLDGSSSDKGVTHWLSYSVNDYANSNEKIRTFVDDYYDTGLATYYAEQDFTLDEKGISFDGTLDIKIFDGDASGKLLYKGNYDSLWSDDIWLNAFYDGAEVHNEQFAEAPYSFKDDSTSPYGNGDHDGRARGQYFRFSTGTVAVSLTNQAEWWRKMWSWCNNWIVIDETAPTIRGWYTDHGASVEGDKLRLSVKFTEPVRVTDESKVKVKATLEGTGDFKNVGEVKFSCVSQGESDVVVFELDPSEIGNKPDPKGSISRIVVTGIENSSYIVDYGRTYDDKNNSCPDLSTDQLLRKNNSHPANSSSDLSVNFDNSVVKVENTSVSEEGYHDSYEVDVKATGGEVYGMYYLWTRSASFDQSADLRQTYEFLNSLDKTTDFSDEAQALYDAAHAFAAYTEFEPQFVEGDRLTASIEGVSGSYYLHVYAKSKYGRACDATASYGPFRLDNTAPIVEDISVGNGAQPSQKAISFDVSDVSGLERVILYVSEGNFSNTASERKAFLLSGSPTDGVSTLVGDVACEETEGKYHYSFTLDGAADLGLNDEKGYGDFHIGVGAIDKLGNASDVFALSGPVVIAIKDTFAPAVSIDGDPVSEKAIFTVGNSYMLDISGSEPVVTVRRNGVCLGDFSVCSFVRTEGSHRYELTKNGDKYCFGEIECFSDLDYHVDPSFDYASVSFTVKNTGYYELTILADIDGEGNEQYSETQCFYFTEGTETAETDNYAALYLGGGVNYKNKLFGLGNTRFYYRTNAGMGSVRTSYYNDSALPLVFSDRDHAVDYLTCMEYMDVYAVRLTAADVLDFENGVITKDRSEEARTPRAGDIWIRYKTSSWNYSTSQRDWAYYYYGDDRESLDIDVNKFSASLKSAIENVVMTIANKGGSVYLTSLDGVDERGVPSLAAERIPGTAHYTETFSGSSIDVTYERDDEMFDDDAVGYGAVRLATRFKFGYTVSTKIYYTVFDENVDYGDNANQYLFKRLTHDCLYDEVGSSCVVLVREADYNGVRDYLVYVDKTSPAIRVNYTDIETDETHNSQWKRSFSDGEVIHASSFTIVSLDDNEYTEGQTPAQYLESKKIDNCAYVAIFELKNGTKTLAACLDREALFDGSGNGYDLLNEYGEGLFEIEVNDRSGNMFNLFVSLTTHPLSAQIECIENDKITITLPDRTPEEIDSFTVNYNGTEKEIDFSSAATLIGDDYGLTFTDAGYYEFTITDKYGCKLLPEQAFATLERAHPRDTVKWAVRSVENGNTVYREVGNDVISLFGSNVYYLTSDDDLTFILDSTEIYSYVISGDAVLSESVSDGKLYVDVTSDDRWTVRIFYTLYPDTSVTYNHIGRYATPPAAISLRAEDAANDGVAQTDTGDRIVLYVTAESELSDAVTVHIKTKDRSAIAALGDYDAYEADVVLTPDAPQQKVTIQTHPSGFTVYDAETATYKTRTFDVVITDIVGNAEKDVDRVECAVPGTVGITAVEKNNVKVFEAYTNGAKMMVDGISMEIASGTESDFKDRYYSFDRDLTINSSWLNYFVETGLANVYYTVGARVSADDSSSASDLQLTLTDISTATQLYKVYLKEINGDNDVIFGYSSGKAKRSGETFNTATAIRLAEARGDAIVGEYFLVPAGSKGNLRLNAYETTYSYRRYTYADAHSEVYYTVYALPERYLSDIFGYSVLIDNKAPEIIGWYPDSETVRMGEKLRLSVRFSEPVYINGRRPAVIAQTGLASQAGFRFELVGGEGTDTLYFEFDPQSVVQEFDLKKLKLLYFENESSIFDFGYNTRKQNNALGSIAMPDRTFDCDVDTRIPRIETTTTVSVLPQRNATLPIEVSYASAGMVVYYSWTTESEAPAQYDRSFTLTSSTQRVNVTGSGLSGIYYLHLKAQSVYGKVTTKTVGPFYFDNAAPVIYNLKVEDATKPLSERTITFYVKDSPNGAAGSGIDKIYMYYSTYGDSDYRIATIYDAASDGNKALIDVNNRVSFVLSFDDLGINREEQRYVELAFFASDALGNADSYTNYVFCPTYVNFDSRSETAASMTADRAELFDAGDDGYVFDTTDPLTLRFTFLRNADSYSVNEVFLGGKTTALRPDEYGDYFEEYMQDDSVVLTFRRGINAVLKLNLAAVSGTGENQNTQYTPYYTIYLTNGVNSAETNNYSAIRKGTVLVNKVYFLGDTTTGGVAYYYHDGTGVRQGAYGSGRYVQAFSDKDKAIEFVRYYEYLDLAAFTIPSDAVAASLNAGDGSYRKAALDSGITAAKGQVWIRYKRATWNEVASADAWVYYYYGNSTEIDLDNLPSSLRAAIDAVVKTIVDKGGYSYLTSYNNGLDADGAPYLRPDQIHTERLSSYTNNLGQEYRLPNVFTGDPDVYDGVVTPAGYEPCALVTAYRFAYGEYTKIFYVRDDGHGNPAANGFKELKEGVTFASLNVDGGVYRIRECDENGVRDYLVYIDKTAPTVSITYVSAKDTQNTIELDASVDGMTINGKKLSVTGIGASEIDALSYVAVFRKSGILVGVYRAEDITANGVEIPEGQYYLVVMDRSGNGYTIDVALNTTQMVVRTVVEENRLIRLTCNRDASEIKTFEVYLDDKLIESNYSAAVTYYNAGFYDIRIEDWFGNAFRYTYELKRELPAIEWYYENGDGSYSLYDGTQQCFALYKIADREYIINTSRALMFTFDSSADYEFYFNDRSVAYSQQEFNGKTRIKVSQTEEWSVRVQYRRFPDIYVVYRCVTDVTAPVINVIARKDIVTFFDREQVEAAGALANENSPRFFVPDTAYFAVTKSISRVVPNNAVVYSALFTVRFSDVSVCTEAEVYLNGKLLGEYRDGNGIRDLALSRTGDYRIVARDALGNESTFVFNNTSENVFEYTVDEKVREVKSSPASYFVIDDNGTSYIPDAYGHEQSGYYYSGAYTATFLITIGERKVYLRYDHRDGVLSEVSYRLETVVDENGNYVYDGNGDRTYRYSEAYTTLVSDVNALSAGDYRQLFYDEQSELSLSVIVSENKGLYFYVTASEHERATVAARFEYDDEYQPYFTETVLSAVMPAIVLEYGDDGERANVGHEWGIVYLKDGFRVVNDFGADITQVSVLYSTDGIFDDKEPVYVYYNGQYAGLGFEEEGYYLVRVENVYGASAEYRVILTNHLQATIRAGYTDGTYNVYSAFDEVIRASSAVEIDVYTEALSYTVVRKGAEGETQSQQNGFNGVCVLIFTENDEYTVVVKDSFSNELTFRFVIDQVENTFKDDYLTGFNEKALKRDQGYTNAALSINADEAIQDGIKAASLIYEGKTYVLFDLLSERVVSVDEAVVNGCVGRYGDGEYVVVLRNDYGTTVSRTVHYKGTSGVTISRRTRTSSVDQIVDTESETVYSNYSVTFATTASLFEVRVDGNKVDMPLTLRFPSDKEENGEYRQTVTYIDEYGFEYEWIVNLVRKELEIDLSEYMNVIEIKETIYTKDDITVGFDGVATCEYTLNGGERQIYVPGQKLTADGSYRFYLTDIAGNVNSSAIVKDTVVEYAFTYAGSDRAVENGGVVNSGSVRFIPVNRDSARIVLAVLNGEETDRAASSSFSENGKWEFIVEDDVGNRSYFCFFILSHATSYFEYETPYLYKITELTYDKGDGVAVSCLDGVLQYENTSKMIFNESGFYEVKATSSVTSNVMTFTVTIDKIPPQVELVGVVNGGKTTENVTLSGCAAGDVVKIYKDDALIRTITVASSMTQLPEIRDSGRYRVVVTNAAGNSIEMTFERKYTANTATTIFVAILFILMAIGLFIGLIYRTRMRV